MAFTHHWQAFPSLPEIPQVGRISLLPFPTSTPLQIWQNPGIGALKGHPRDLHCCQKKLVTRSFILQKVILKPSLSELLQPFLPSGN